MEIKFTIKIKDEKNPPTFKEELGKGVLETVIVNFKELREDDLKTDVMFASYINDLINEFKENWIEVKCEIINKK